MITTLKAVLCNSYEPQTFFYFKVVICHPKVLGKVPETHDLSLQNTLQSSEVTEFII
jgi:hypothetical protein